MTILTLVLGWSGVEPRAAACSVTAPPAAASGPAVAAAGRRPELAASRPSGKLRPRPRPRKT